ncbi:MAG: hypothetical protein R2939_16840 [Kofleriaceae bacterium]
MQRLLAALGHRVWALAVVAIVAALALLPDLGSPGLWEPHELAVADKAVAQVDAADDAAAPAPAAPTSRSCKQPPDTDGARTLTGRAVAWGFQTTGSDRGMRLPLELLGLITVLACAGVGYRLRGPRAALLTGLVCLSFPLLALQARQLTSEIGTAAGAALIIYGLTAACRRAPGRWAILDGVGAAVALAAGAWLAFAGGGALLGLLVPVGAFAIATGGGLRAIPALGRLAAHAMRRSARARAGRARTAAEAMGCTPATLLARLVGLVALLASLGLLAWLAHQTYDVRAPLPGSRQLAGHSIVPTDCWSTALGGVWTFADNTRLLADAGIAQIAVGTFPWGLLAPLAIGLLLYASDGRGRFVGQLTAAWAALAWLCTALFLRKVGFTIYAGFPAMAIAIGVWLDRLPAWRPDGGDDDDGGGVRRYLPMVGLFFALAVLVLAKDLVAFPDELTTLLSDIEINTKEAKVYPKAATLLGLPAKLLVAGIGVLAIAALLTALANRPGADGRSPLARALRAITGPRSLAIVVGALVVTSLWWTHGWHRALSKNLSSKQIFATLADERADGERLGIMGNMGNAPRYYGAGTWEKLANREAALALLREPGRTFAMIPLTELCGLHRAASGQPYVVLDDSSTRTLLLSNQAGGRTDRNPLASRVLREEPRDLITTRPPSPIVYDNKLELIGWSLPARVGRGDEFTLRLVFKVRAPVSGSWKIFAHFDGGGARFQGDHDPIDKVCATSFWQAGDYIVDTTRVSAGDMSTTRGQHDVRIGFFTGSNPNWRNMKVTSAPAGAVDDNDRVRIGAMIVD